MACGLLFMAQFAQAEPIAKKDWTMLVFINGHNNLDDYGAYNINQMEKVGSTDDFNVVVQWASLAAKKTTKRLFVQKDNDINKVSSPVVQELPKVDMGDKKSLLDFIKWGADNFPAEHYFVAVWNHGSGWHLKNASGDDIHANDISFDDTTGHHITTEQLAEVMEDATAYIGHPVDIYGSDACLMAMVEIAHEMAGSVTTFVGSEEVEPGDGWPYDGFLERWSKRPGANSNEVGGFLVDAYKAYYQALGNSTTTLSALDVTKLPALVEEIGLFREKLLSVKDLNPIAKAAKDAQRYTYSDYVDIGDVVDRIKVSLIKQGETNVDFTSLRSALSAVVVANGITGGKSTGVSMWWPVQAYQWNSNKTRYKGLKFDQDVHWSDVLQKLF